MKTSHWLFLAAVVLLTAAIGFGCASKPQPIPTVIDDEFSGAPDWVTQGCSSYFKNKDEAAVTICGVGSVGGTRNVSLAITGAEGRARTAIARSLQAKVKAMLKDYAATTTGGEEFGRHAADDQYLADVAKQITDLTVAGTERRALWTSKKGTVYVLVVMDLKKFKGAISQMGSLSEGVRKAVEERAEKAFQELDKETEKEKSGQ